MKRVAALAFLLSVLALSGAPPGNAEAARQQILDFVRAYADVQNKNDATAMMELYSKKPGVSSVSLGSITRGWDAIRADVDRQIGSQGLIKLTLGVVDVETLGAANALAVAPFSAALHTDQGDVQVRGALTLVLEKTAGKWKVLHEHASIELPEIREEGD